MLDPSRAEETLGAGVIVGVHAGRDRSGAGTAAAALQAGLREVFPGRPALAVVLTGDEPGALDPGAPIAPPAPGEPPPLVRTGPGSGPEAALQALLEVTLASGAPACALLEPLPRPADARWLRAVLDPVLRGEADLVAPAYARRRFEGVLVTGLAYPLVRAVFGQRLRQPLGRELVLSRSLAGDLARDDAWRFDPAHAGTQLWVVTTALARDSRLAQVFLGPRPVPQAQPADVADALARVLGTIFHAMDLHAARWQRIRASRDVLTFGDEDAPEDPAAAPAPGPMVAAFELGWQDLRALWATILPPRTLHALQRVAGTPPAGFRMADVLWARIVYDFAVAWRVKTLDRGQLLHSLAPLYLGWVASFVNEVAPLDDAAAEARVEALCAAFEAEKPYLISRWRWPDSFTP